MFAGVSSSHMVSLDAGTGEPVQQYVKMKTTVGGIAFLFAGLLFALSDLMNAGHKFEVSLLMLRQRLFCSTQPHLPTEMWDMIAGFRV